MRLNVKKSSIMWFSPKQASSVVLPPILVDGYQFQNIDKQKYLGILFNKNLQWGLFTFAEPSPQVFKMLTESLILSRIDYALPV